MQRRTAPAGRDYCQRECGHRLYDTDRRVSGQWQCGCWHDNPARRLVVTNGNVGIGTWAPGTALQVGTNTLVVNTATGNIGIGTGTTNNVLSVLGGAGFGTYATTTAPAGGIIASGNVGIGSTAPGQKLDVTGTVRAMGFTMSGQTPISGYVLTATDTSGDTTWTSPGTSSGWTVSGSNVYETSSGNVGIGTTTVTQGALVVTNGNVGIGTWAPVKPCSCWGDNSYVMVIQLLQRGIVGNAGTGQQQKQCVVSVWRWWFWFLCDNGGSCGRDHRQRNVGIGYTTPTGALAVNGNVGVGRQPRKAAWL